MKNIICTLIVCCLIYSQCFAGMLISGGVEVEVGSAPDWTADASCRAYYSFEGIDSVRDDDSASTNDLTEINSGTYPASDTTNESELLACASFTPAGTDAAYSVAQTAMTAAFPGNGPGDSEVTIGGWIRVTTLASADYLWSITSDIVGSGDGIFTLVQIDAVGSLQLSLNDVAAHMATADLVANTRYFIAAVFSGDRDEVMLYIRSSDGTTLYEYNTTETTETALDDITASGGFGVGTRNTGTGAFYGQLDGLGVFTKAFTKTEIDDVFINGWDGNGW